MVAYYKDANIGIIEFNDPDSKVNLLSSSNLDALNNIIDCIVRNDKFIEALFFISKKEGVFIAGADINELAAIRKKEEALELCKKGQNLFDRIEDLIMPSFAVVNGACLGGGLELALSCRYLLATRNKKVKLGFPEVKLGIIPGFGGPHRLAEKIGTKKADYLITTGEIIDARKAKYLRLVDRVIDESEHPQYKKIIQLYRRMQREKPEPTLQKYRERSELNKSERDAVAEKIVLEPARNSLSSYLLVSKYRNYPWQETAVRPEEESFHIKHCAVVGAGTMGKGIGYLLSSTPEVSVDITDVNRSTLRKAKVHIRHIYRDALKKGILYRNDARAGFKSISFDKVRFKDSDIVIEAVTEEVSVKKALFAEIEKKLNKECILATNTSCISVEELSRSLNNAEGFLGLHFFNPAYKMKLVEVIPTRFTSKAVLKRAISFLRQLKRIPVIVKDSPGFLVNRMLLPYLNEAIFMLQDGFSAEDIENAMLGFGMPMGPLRLLKEIGLDVAYRACKKLEHFFGDRMRVPYMLKEKYQIEHFERYSFRSHRPKMPPQDIVKRLLLPMKREAGLCLKEQVADNREIIDLALLLGIGFPNSKRIWEI